MTTSNILGLPFIATQQAQPEVTHNKALVMIQALLQGAVALQNAPPGVPGEGDLYIVGTAPTGAWATHANHLAVWYGGAWLFVPGFDSTGTAISMGTAQEGLTVYRQDTNALVVWDGAAWVTLSAGGSAYVLKTGDTMTGGLTINVASSALLLISDGGTSGLGAFTKYVADANVGAFFILRHARGSLAVPADELAGDRMGILTFGGYAGGGFRNVCGIEGRAGTGTISATSLPSYLAFLTSPDGSIARTERLRIDQDGNLGVGANVWLDVNRIFRLRSYTVATLPASPAAGSFAYCSDETGGAVPVFGDGTNWRRVTDRNIAA